MSKHQEHAKSVFERAVEIVSIERRVAFLAEEYEKSPQIKPTVEGLLIAFKDAGSFLENPAIGPSETIDSPNRVEAEGQSIGKYKLMEQIGEGGMGVVYVAEQTKPVKRRVALKVIKPGMDSREVIARFEAERQALALMDHPSIAKVFDAGMTDNGRPYFVMELINGAPMTEYCDAQKLSIRERLELFIQVCNAIQHAHRKGVIHRDVKPSNVLVTLHDGRPVPVVIDFGVAKAIHQSLTEQTIYTRLNQVVGTTLYMSPEQAELSRYGVDTRTDVYSLGVMLYELLTGTTPFDQERLSRAGFDEIRRIIREEDPPKPSTRISALGQTATDVSYRRDTDPVRLSSTIRGDLDWIVMKAIEKDRSRRYESASRLSDDIVNHLNNQIVEARPPSLVYRTQKVWRRNRLLIGGVSFVLLILTSALIVSLWGIQERDRTLAQLQQVVISQGLQQALIGEDIEDSLHLAIDAKVTDDWIETIKGAKELHQGDNPTARAHFEKALSIDAGNVAARCMLTIALFHDARLNEHAGALASIDELSPRKDFEEFDKLFLGYARIYQDRSAAAGEIQKVLVKHPSWVFAHAMLAGALGEAGLAKRDHNLSLEAIREISIPQAVAGENPFVLMVNLFAHGAACTLSPDEALRENGLELARKLEDFPDYELGCYIRALFHENHGDAEKAETLWMQLAGSRGNFASTATAALFRRGKDDYVIGLSHNNPSGKLAQAYLLAQIEARSGEARDALHELEDSRLSDTWWGRNSVLQLILLLKDRQLAQKKCRQWLIDSEGLPDRDFGEMIRPTLEEIAGIKSETPRAEYSRQTRRHMQFFEALRAFAREDVPAARKSLENYVQERGLGSSDHWARAFLERWEPSVES